MMKRAVCPCGDRWGAYAPTITDTTANRKRPRIDHPATLSRCDVGIGLHEREKMNWKKFSEELPPDEVICLVLWLPSDNRWSVGFFDHLDNEGNGICDNDYYSNLKASHWCIPTMSAD